MVRKLWAPCNCLGFHKKAPAIKYNDFGHQKGGNGVPCVDHGNMR